MLMSEKYSVHDYTVEQILNFIKSSEIAIPEIQRPFVWKGKQVRDLVDSLYKGYPTGYLIISKSPDLKLKDGSLSVGKKIMIDGQQRVTAMMTALSGLEVFNADFEKKHIAIAYNPFAKNDEECFAVQDNAILKDKKWRITTNIVLRPITSIMFLRLETLFIKYDKLYKNIQPNNDANSKKIGFSYLFWTSSILPKQLSQSKISKDINKIGKYCFQFQRKYLYLYILKIYPMKYRQ